MTGVSRHGRLLRRRLAGATTPPPPPLPSPAASDTVLAVIQLSARLCETSCTRHGPHYALKALGGKPLHRLACTYGTDAGGQSHPAFPHTLHRKRGSVSGDCTCLETIFGRDLPLCRQLQLQHQPCQAHWSLAQGCSGGPENGQSNRRPTGQPGSQSWASADRVWRSYTPYKSSEKGGWH